MSAASILQENKKLQKFFANDRPPRKRAKAALDFFSSFPQDLVAVFWENHRKLVYSVIGNCIADLEMLYLPHPTAFGIKKKKSFDREDWADTFDLLEQLIIRSADEIDNGWQSHGFNGLLAKLLKADNMPYVQFRGYKCLVMLTDCLSGHAMDGAHISLLGSSVDFSTYATSGVQLPKREHDFVEGWKRDGVPNAEEPVNMLKFLLDYSLDTEDRVKQSAGDTAVKAKFKFWCEVFFSVYCPILYPKVCIRMGLKNESDDIGFFHHCPGSFQRLFARWIYKIKNSEPYLEVLWSDPKYIEILMESLRQRFAYRDSDLIMDAIRLYTGWCENTTYIPKSMKFQMPEIMRRMISHCSQSLTGESHFEETTHQEITTAVLNFLESLSMNPLDEETFAFLRKTLLLIMNGSYAKSESAAIRSTTRKMVSILFRTWMYNVHTEYGSSPQVWAELAKAIRKWLVNDAQRNDIGMILISKWRMEMLLISHVCMEKMAPETASEVLNSVQSPVVNNLKKLERSGGFEDDSLLESKQNAFTPTFLRKQCGLRSINEAILLLDRLLHLIPVSTLEELAPKLHFKVVESISDVISLWLDVCVSPESTLPCASDVSYSHQKLSERMSNGNEKTPGKAKEEKLKLPPNSRLKSVTPGTLLSLYSPWIYSACNYDGKHEKEKNEFQKSRSLGLRVLLCLATTRVEAKFPPHHIGKISRLMMQGLSSCSFSSASSSNSLQICFTILQHGMNLFTMDIPGINILIPIVVRSLRDILGICLGKKRFQFQLSVSFLSSLLDSILTIVFSLSSFPLRYPMLSLDSWEMQYKEFVESCALNDEDKKSFEKMMMDVPTLESLPLLLGDVLQMILSVDGVFDVLKQKALWGIYYLTVMELVSDQPKKLVPRERLEREQEADRFDEEDGDREDDEEEEIEDVSLIKKWVTFVCETCNSNEIALSLTSIEVLTSLSDYYTELNGKEHDLIPHILLTLSLMTQEQMEEACIRIQQSLGNIDLDYEPSDNSNSSSPHSDVNGAYPNIRKHSKKGTVSPPPPGSHEAAAAFDIKTLESIVCKTSAIFDCMRVWLMIDTVNILKYPTVCKVIFGAIEAALVGKLPTGSWVEQVESYRKKNGKNSNPLLFIGLQMIASLERDRERAPLKCFADTAAAAEGLLLHLLHHFHNFPTASGPDQVSSSCTELKDDLSDSTSALSFIYMDSMIITVMGGINSACSRIVIRDITGTFTWDSKANNPEPNMEIKVLPKSCGVSQATKALSKLQERCQAVELSSYVGVELTDTGKSYLKQMDRIDREKKRKKKESIADIPTDLIKLVHYSPDSMSFRRNQSSIDVLNETTFHPEKAALEVNGEMVSKEEKHSTVDTDSSRSSNGESEEDSDSSSSDYETRSLDRDPPKAQKNSILGLFDVYAGTKGIGSMDGERSLLDLVVDSIPLRFQDCEGPMVDTTLFGGTYTMDNYQKASDQFLVQQTNRRKKLLNGEEVEFAWSLENDLPSLSSNLDGLSFLNRLMHDQECYGKFRKHLGVEDKRKYIDFLDSVRKYYNQSTVEDRLAQVVVIFWEFLSMDGLKYIEFPAGTSRQIQNKMQNGDMQDNLFEDLIVYLEHADLSASIESFKLSQEVSIQMQNYDEFSLLEHNIWNYMALFHRKRQQILSTDNLGFPPCIPGTSSVPISALDQCRLLLSQIGLVPPSHSSSLKILDNSTNLVRSLNHLDSSPSRETMKIGVIYVAPKQRTQQEILHNSCGSREYEEFLDGLGWEVDLLAHRGFTGGLDCNPKSLSTGRKCYYYSNSSTEVVYHVVTRMPTRDGDKQQIDKKRHVGNDYVHIVWSENYRDYFPHTISSHFNDVQIVIYPLKESHSGMYRIQIFSKTAIPVFGPLMSGMIVCKGDLARLVRQTAINGNRLCRLKTSIYRPPYPTRKRILQEIGERYTNTYSDKDMLNRLFSINPNARSASASTSTSTTASATGSSSNRIDEQS